MPGDGAVNNSISLQELLDTAHPCPSTQLVEEIYPLWKGDSKRWVHYLLLSSVWSPFQERGKNNIGLGSQRRVRMGKTLTIELHPPLASYVFVFLFSWQVFSSLFSL